jgi:ABC-type uncharacterized transport system substrate-binding protein
MDSDKLNKIEKFAPDKVLDITTPKVKSMTLPYFTIEAIPRNNDMVYHVTSIKVMEDIVFQRIAYRILIALNTKIPDQYYTNIIPVRQLNSFSVEIFGIVNHPQRNAICSGIFKALVQEFSSYDNPKAIERFHELAKHPF